MIKKGNTSKNDNSKETFSVITNQNDIIKPEFVEDRHEYVKYGKDNDFPIDLLALFNRSGIHNAIIESKVRMMGGDGIVQDVESEEELSDKTQEFIDHPNQYESLNAIYGKLSLDYEIHGLAYIEVIWGKGYKEIAEIHHIDATKIRWGKFNDKGRIDTYFYSQDWLNTRKYKPLPIPIFDDTKKEARQILPIVRYSPGIDYYTLPDYFGGLKWIYIDTEIANFHFNNLKNGMSPTIFFSFPVGDKSEDERREISDKLKEKYQGTNNAGKMLLAFYDAEGDAKPEIKVIEMSNSAKQFDLLNKTSLQQILIAHKITNENLVGIATPGKLGGGNELLEAYDLYFNTVIKYEQARILDPLNRIFLINGFNPIKIVDNKPFEFTLSENVLKEILTQDELREKIGYDIIDIEEEVEVTDTGATFAGVRTITELNYVDNLPKAIMSDLYRWKTMGDDPCPSCTDRNGKTQTLSLWMDEGMPGVPTGYSFDGEDGHSHSTNFTHSPYSTFCEANCVCRLVKTGQTK